MGVSRQNWDGNRPKAQRARRGAQNHYTKRLDQNMKNGLRLGFRSGLEATNAHLIEARGETVRFEELKIPYVVPESTHKYTPDFELDNGIIVETKGKLEPKDRAKHILIKEQHPELDIRIVFQRPHDKIRKGSKTTYAMWCDHHGIKWASKVIPEVWMKEAGPKKKPAEVLG